jgi:uncharacterized membrane protein
LRNADCLIEIGFLFRNPKLQNQIATFKPMIEALTSFFPLAQQTPTFDGTYLLLLAARLLHMLGAAIIVGGLFYLRSVVTPAAPVEVSDAQFGGRRAAWAMLVGIATLFLLVSGFFNYFYMIKNYEKMPFSYHMLFGLKFLAGLVLFFLAALVAGRSNLAQQIRQNLRLWLNVCLALGLAIIVLGGVMRTYPRFPKGTEPAGIRVASPDGERINP